MRTVNAKSSQISISSKSLAKLASLAVLAFVVSACSSKVMKADNAELILKNDEFDKRIQVEAISITDATGPDAAKSVPESGKYVRFPGPAPIAGAFPPPPAVAPGKVPSKVSAPKKPIAANLPTVAPTPLPTPQRRQPLIEDTEGFAGRRPIKDPFRVGEKIVLDVSYFGVSAGDMTLEVRDFVQVNGRRSYTFSGTAVSTSVFAMFYAVDDRFDTFLDYEDMRPYSYSLHVKETKQLRETRSVFDWKTGKALFWDKKINPDQRVEEKKMEWEIAAFAQNVFSAPFYLRTFQLKPGKKLAFPLAHENENLVLTGEVLRRERISTPAGDFDTVVVKPKIELNGVFKPVGDIFIWLTDDDRKFIVRIESKIKIGTIVAVAKRVEPGR